MVYNSAFVASGIRVYEGVLVTKKHSPTETNSP